MICKNKPKSNFDLIILVILFFTSVDTICFGTNAIMLYKYIPRVIGMLAIFVLIFKYFSMPTKKNFIFYFSYIIIFSMYFISCIVNGVSFSGFISRLVSITVGFAIALSIDKRNFLNAFKKIVYVICIISIITEVIAYVFPSIFSIFPKVYNTVGNEFKFFILGSIETIEIGKEFIRANGIFWEPGAFAIYIVINLIFELFNNNPNIKRIIINIIALLITFSTTGYVCLIVLLITFLLSKNNTFTRIKAKKVVVFSLIIFSFLFIFFQFNLYDVIFGKIISGNSSAGSRFSSFFNGISLSIKNPIFGLGENTVAEMEKYISTTTTWYKNGGNNITNTIIGYMASYGIPFAILMLIGSLNFFTDIGSNKFESLMLFLVLMLCYMGERFFSFFPFIFVFYGFSSSKIK